MPGPRTGGGRAKAPWGRFERVDSPNEAHVLDVVPAQTRNEPAVHKISREIKVDIPRRVVVARRPDHRSHVCTIAPTDLTMHVMVPNSAPSSGCEIEVVSFPDGGSSEGDRRHVGPNPTGLCL